MIKNTMIDNGIQKKNNSRILAPICERGIWVMHNRQLPYPLKDCVTRAYPTTH